MPKIVIVGGKLQGSEAAYLGREAGIDIILIDRDPDAPAQKMCTGFICGDVISGDERIAAALEEADMILPTMENDTVLEGLSKLADEKGYILAFDWDAYQISSSKKRSDRLFADNGLPCPKCYPDGKAPYIVKPESESGSHGVVYMDSSDELEEYIAANGSDAVIQEFLQGPSYSVEIIGSPGNYRTYVPTQIFVDDVYDCNLASALRDLEPEKKKELDRLAVTIAELVELKGIMDLEVIDDGEELRILEIDARLPSQTSIVVYHASGMNYIKELYDLFCCGDFADEQTDTGCFASLTHYRFDRDGFSTHGEHIMVEGGLLDHTEGLCRRARVISDHDQSCGEWRGTFINFAPTAEELEEAEADMLDEFSRFSD